MTVMAMAGSVVSMTRVVVVPVMKVVAAMLEVLMGMECIAHLKSHRVVVARLANAQMIRVEFSAIAIHAQRVTTIVGVETAFLNRALHLGRGVTTRTAIALHQFAAEAS